MSITSVTLFKLFPLAIFVLTQGKFVNGYVSTKSNSLDTDELLKYLFMFVILLAFDKDTDG